MGVASPVQLTLQRTPMGPVHSLPLLVPSRFRAGSNRGCRISIREAEKTKAEAAHSDFRRPHVQSPLKRQTFMSIEQ